MVTEAINSSISPYINQFTGFVSKNWAAFKNASVEYGTKIYASGTVQKVIEYVKPLINKLDHYYPNSLRFSSSTTVAAAVVASSLTGLALISYFTGGNKNK